MCLIDINRHCYIWGKEKCFNRKNGYLIFIIIYGVSILHLYYYCAGTPRQVARSFSGVLIVFKLNVSTRY